MTKTIAKPRYGGAAGGGPSSARRSAPLPQPVAEPAQRLLGVLAGAAGVVVELGTLGQADCQTSLLASRRLSVPLRITALGQSADGSRSFSPRSVVCRLRRRTNLVAKASARVGVASRKLRKLRSKPDWGSSPIRPEGRSIAVSHQEKPLRVAASAKHAIVSCVPRRCGHRLEDHLVPVRRGLGERHQLSLPQREIVGVRLDGLFEIQVTVRIGQWERSLGMAAAKPVASRKRSSSSVERTDSMVVCRST